MDEGRPIDLTLYFFWSSMAAQRVRLALGYKHINYRAVALSRDDDETFFELGMARQPFVAVMGEAVFTDSTTLLAELDGRVGGVPIFDGVLPSDAWAALLRWRDSVEHLLARLHAPVLPAFIDIAASEEAHLAYKADVERRFGLSVEALSNDRYDGYQQLSRVSRLPELARHLAREKFYFGGKLTAADCLLAADLFPLQLLDGVTLPVDLLYYLDRVEKACDASIREGLANRL